MGDSGISDRRWLRNNFILVITDRRKNNKITIGITQKESEDNDDVYFIENTREIVIVFGDGYIRTYFITDRSYFERQ